MVSHEGEVERKVHDREDGMERELKAWVEKQSVTV
jgi:hypothetical protein